MNKLIHAAKKYLGSPQAKAHPIAYTKHYRLLRNTIKNAVVISFIFSCILINNIQGQSTIDSALVGELERMIVLDQLAASNAQPPEGNNSLSQKEWKDSIYRAHQSILEKVLDDHGYPGFNMVGKRGSQLYWAMVQHSDFDPSFQKRVLDSMYVEVQNNNADPRNYAYLTDRVNLNFNKDLVYGTQLTYNLITGQAHYKTTIDPENLNKRRAEIGLEPIEDYLEQMTKDHLQNNSIIDGITNVALLLLLVVAILIGGFIFFLVRRKKAIDKMK
jgi:hypothetical protein